MKRERKWTDMNLSKYNLENLFVKAENALRDYKSFRDALNFIPESSVLGYMSVKASAAMRLKSYEKYKAEIINRDKTQTVRAALIQLETKYGYREKSNI